MRKSPFTFSAVGVFLVAFLAVAQAQNITTLAGGGPNNLPAASSAIGTPWAVVQDGRSNTFISDNLSNRVFQVNKNGTLTVLAGNIYGSYRGDGQLGTVASLNSPEGIAVDGSGNVYIADTVNNAIRVVNTQSSPITLGGLPPLASLHITTIAGSGTAGYSPNNTLATNASLNSPGGVWLDEHNNIYIADTVNSVIEVVNTQASPITVAGVTVQPNDIATVAGINQAGFSGDGGLATAAKISQPLGVFVDSKGNIFIADTMNNRIRVVNTQSTAITVATVVIQPNDIKTVAGNGTEGFSGDTGAATSAELNHPSAVFVDGSGNIYIADGDGDANGTTSNNRIRKITTDGKINTIAGSATQCFYNLAPCGDGGLATSAKLWAPTGVIVDGTGDIFIADQNDDAIREVTSGNIHTAMGILLDTAFSGDGGIATDAELRSPAGVVSDASGNAYITDTGNSTIRKVNSSGIISTAVGCLVGPCGDGVLATSARLFTPSQTAFDSAGNMYIAEAGNGGNDIRVVNNQSTNLVFYPGPNQVTIKPGFIGTIAGTVACTMLPCGDGGPAVFAQLNQPEGLFLDKAGNIYIADTGDNAIRVVNTQSTGMTFYGVSVPSGDIATIAGTLDISPTGDCPSGTTSCGDGGPATSALLSLPFGVAVDSVTGNIYIADAADNRVRFVNPSGTINRFAGTGAPCQNNCGDGGLAINALLDGPQGLFVDYVGNVFIADTFDYSIREVTIADGKINAVVDSTETSGFFGDGGSALAAGLTNPSGVAGDPLGNLLIADTRNWRARKVSPGSVITPPRADLSTNQLPFFDQPIHRTSAGRPVTLSNDGFGTPLTISTNWTLSGTNASDFAIASNTCTGSLPAESACIVTIKFSPSAKGTRVATLTITDNAGGVSGAQQSVALSGIGVVATALVEQVDYFGEGTADFTVWRPSTGTWYSLDSSGREVTKQFGASTDIPLVGDYDGDGKTDFTVRRPSTGTWYILQSSNGKEIAQQFGASGDVPVPGDYDGDGKTDIAVRRPSNGTWYILQSSNGKEIVKQFGGSADVPVPGDYDGDGKTDIAVRRPSNGTWYILQSSNGKEIAQQFGGSEDVPVPGDYDGDGKTDIAVWRPSNGTWYILQSSNGEEVARQLGQKGDVPVARDYDGDGKTDVAVWRPSTGTWYVIESSTGKTITKQWGASTDIPINKPVGQ
jgi:streptogramin lyase/glucan-binding YG repeat protein